MHIHQLGNWYFARCYNTILVNYSYLVLYFFPNWFLNWKPKNLFVWLPLYLNNSNEKYTTLIHFISKIKIQIYSFLLVFEFLKTVFDQYLWRNWAIFFCLHIWIHLVKAHLFIYNSLIKEIEILNYLDIYVTLQYFWEHYFFNASYD